MSCRDIVKPSQKESSGDNVYDKLRKRLQRHFLGRKKVSTIAKWNTSLKLTPVPWVLLFSSDGMIIRTKFTCNSSELHDTSLALIDIPECRERDYGERDGWVERGTRSICETIQSVFPKTQPWLEPRPFSSARQLVVPCAMRQNTTC